MNTRYRLLIVSLLALLADQSAVADRPSVPPTALMHWEMELEQHGVATDTASVIQAALTHHDSGVRFSAVELLGWRGEHEAEGGLRRVLEKDEERLVREGAALALARLGYRDALGAVRGFLMTSSGSHQLYLARELAKLGDFYGYRFVRAAAVAQEEELRRRSPEALLPFLTANFDPGEGLASPGQLLTQLLRDKGARVRQEAIFAVSYYSTGATPRPPFPEHRAIVEEMGENDPLPVVREQALRLVAAWTRSAG